MAMQISLPSISCVSSPPFFFSLSRALLPPSRELVRVRVCASRLHKLEGSSAMNVKVDLIQKQWKFSLSLSRNFDGMHRHDEQHCMELPEKKETA
jgi:hypothetical protein